MTRTHTTSVASGGRPSSARARWSDLPDDILENIRLKLTSLPDRVRLDAVCTPWRTAAARLPAPPAVPLLLLSPRSPTGETKQLCGCNPDDRWALHIHDKAANKWLMGSHQGGWVAALDHMTRKLVLVNLFSGADVEVRSSWPANPWADCLWNPISPVILSDDPTTSSGCVLAIVTDQTRNVALCKVGCDSGWIKQNWKDTMFADITFCGGDLYGLLYPTEETIRFKIDTKGEGLPMITSTHKLAIQKRHGPRALESYIVELHGKPSKAIMTSWLPDREPFFKIFELVDTDTNEAYRHKWAEVRSLGDYALFLGPGNSKAVHVPVGADRCGFERNHIYYITRDTEINLCGDEVYSMRLVDDRLMYCREDRNIEDGLAQTGYYTAGWKNDFMWLHPPEL